MPGSWASPPAISPPWAPVIATYAAFLLSGVYGLGRIVLRRGSRKDHIAFGPWMLVGALLALLVEIRPLL